MKVKGGECGEAVFGEKQIPHDQNIKHPAEEGVIYRHSWRKGGTTTTKGEGEQLCGNPQKRARRTKKKNPLGPISQKKKKVKKKEKERGGWFYKMTGLRG